MLSEQGSTLFTAVNALIGTLVAIQLWLVTVSLEALYSNETTVLVPALAASLVLFLLNFGMLRHALRFDRRRRRHLDAATASEAKGSARGVRGEG
jgi:hypothetical protein